jgi:hypothetical protein
MKLAQNFWLHEFLISSEAAKLGIRNIPNKKEIENLKLVANTLQAIRLLIGNKPIRITSGFRNAKLNKAVGGVPSSHHRLGFAADFVVSDLAPSEICRIVKNSDLQFDQIIDEAGRYVHLSIHPRNRRQVLRGNIINNKKVYRTF